MKLLELSKPGVSAKEDCTGTQKFPTISYLVAKDRINDKLRAWNCKRSQSLYFEHNSRVYRKEVITNCAETSHINFQESSKSFKIGWLKG